ncbi:MAG: hypothetical protein J6X95_03460 [Treponema sp.]|nr:hypothetical protein [Treponema sp.]
METQTNTSVAFLDDDEKLLDFDRVSKKRFLAAYSYLTEEEYDATKKELKKLDKSATQVVVDRRIQKGMDVLERTGADISKLDFDGKEKLLNETMSELEKRWEEKKDLCVSRYGMLFEINYEQLADLIKARDAFKAEKKLEQAPLEYLRPNAKALEWGFDDGWHFKEVINGYSEFVDMDDINGGPTKICRLDIMDVFESDYDAATQYEIDTGIKILQQNRDLFPDTDSNEMLEYGEFPATEKNLKWFAKNGLLLKQPLEFKWDKFTEEQFEKLYEEVKNRSVGEGFKGTVEIGGLSVEMFRRSDNEEDVFDCCIFQLDGKNEYSEKFGVPYDQPDVFTVPFRIVNNVNYGGFKHRLEKNIIDEIAPYKELRIAASQKTVDWDNEKAVKGYWSERLGERLADSFATLDFKPEEWSELLNKGADAREAIKTAAEDANLGDNLNWLLDNVPQEKLNEYFSDKQYCEEVFEIAKESFIRSGVGDKETETDVYTDAFVKLSELMGKENEMRHFGENLMLDAGIAVKVFPYAKDSQSVEAVRDFLAKIEGYPNSDEIGDDKVRAFIDNIGRPLDDGNYIIVGTKDNIGYIEWHDNERPETITYLPEILAEIESWADSHRTGQDEKSEQYLDYNYIHHLKQVEEMTNAARIEKIFDGIQSELGNGSAQTFAEMREWVKENFPGKTDRGNIVGAASRMIEGAADFGELNPEEFDARYGNGEASEKRMDLADFAAARVFTGKLSSWKEIQSFVSRESEKFMRETKAELEKEILSEIKEKWTFGDAAVPDAVKIYNPKDFGLEDNGKLHVLLQFHIADSNEFGSAMPEDGLFNLINSDWQDDKFGELEIDFNPIDVAKSGTIEEYLANMKSHYEKELAEEKNSDIHKTIAETVEKSVDEVFKEKFPLASNEGREVAVPLEQAHLETAEEIESFMAKEAEEYVANKSDKGNFDVEKFGAAFFSESSMRIAFRDAATFGYNMAKNNITELQEKYDKLLSEHEKLQADYDKLLDNFNNLSSGRAKRQKNSGMGY